MSRISWRLAASAVLLVSGLLISVLQADEPRVLLEVGRDYPETRMFGVCSLVLKPGAKPLLGVAGFSQTGHGDVAHLSVFDVKDNGNPKLLWRLMRGGSEASSIRSLRAADLDGDHRDELICLGRVGDEHVDSRGELQVFKSDEEQWKAIALERWQSGQYTHGFGMDIADLDGDRRPEIISGGFFLKGESERGELRIWRLEDSHLKLIASTAWGADTGHTRVNSVCVGDITGDGKVEIVSAGRTGQIKEGEHLTTHEADQLVVWRFEASRLVRHLTYESDPKTRSRFREVKLVELDGEPGLELLAVGRHDPPLALARGPGTGGGGGRGTGGGGGKGTGGGRAAAEQSAPIRPLVSVFGVANDSLKRICDADFGDALGEVRDIAPVGGAAGDLQLVTIAASELKPNCSAQLDFWQWKDASLRSKTQRVVELGDETRARQIILWGPSEQRRLLTIGFVMRGEQILGQILDWGPL